jgi:hypothetical protein
MRSVIEIEVESHIEEQYILEKFPESVWISPAGFGVSTRFYLPYNEMTQIEVEQAIQEWEERGAG